MGINSTSLTSKMGGFSWAVFAVSLALLTLNASTNRTDPTTICVEEERLALLDFKSSFFTIENHHLIGLLSSWEGKECCKWQGILCSNVSTGQVTRLDIRNRVYPDSFGYITDVPNRLTATRLSSALLELKFLEYLDLSWNDFSGSEIPSFLGSMKRLRYLNLSNARFNGLVPPQLGHLSSLQVLDLSSGPSEHDHELFVQDLGWLSGLGSLGRLDLSWVNLAEALGGLSKVLNSLPLLTYLRLSSCGLGDHGPDGLDHHQLNLLFSDYVNSTLLQHFDASVNGLQGSIPDVFRNMSSLRVLDLSANLLNTTIPPWIGSDLARLVRLNLGFNYLRGTIPESLGSLESLEFLDLSFNALDGNFPSSLWDLCSLKTLDFKMNNLNGTLLFEPFNTSPFGRCNGKNLEKLSLSLNKFTGPLPAWLGHYLLNLKTLVLANNSFYGQIPDSFGNFSKLEILDLSHNQLNGSVPESLGQLSMLKVLILSSNSLQGTMSEVHLENLSRLKEMDTKDNPLALQFRPQWLPPFQIVYLNLGSCNIGPQFPNWLRNQRQIVTLYLSNTSIADTVPRWFPGLKFFFLDLSYNNIKGRLPTFLTPNCLYMNLYLSNNRFEGPLPAFPFNLNRLDLINNLISGDLPSDIGTMTPTLDNLLLSGNQITGPIPDSLCKIRTLRVLDLSKNRLSGDIPDCWSDFKILVVLDLSENHFSGVVPSSFGGATALKSLHLSNNTLHGDLPMSLRDCTKLVILDLGENRLSGILPKWIGKSLLNLEILRLRSNMLEGDIPLEICRLTQLQVLDISQNNMSGTIPTCFGNLKGMMSGDGSASEIGVYRWSTTYGENTIQFMKGKALEYTKTLRLLINMDISGNQMTGTIPEELTKLIALRGLNLSGNHLEGNIPAMIGNIKYLESLDLSWNKLSGPIPHSVSFLNFLSHLNLSYNDLSGEIPSGNQLQTLDDPSIYFGNSALCGAPLRECKSPEPSGARNEGQGQGNGDDDDDNLDGLYISLSAGYVTGLWGVLGIMFFKTNWRNAYFRCVDNVKERTSSAIRTRLTSLKREQRSNRNQIDEWRWTTMEGLERRR